MVGVPTSKGCLACRQQKKKCLGQAAICTRCARLGLQCVGRNQQRFKFHDENARFDAAERQCRASSDLVSSSSSVAQSPGATPSSLSSVAALTIRTPSSDIDQLARMFVISIDPYEDSRFQLLGAFGPLLKEIPSHLGHNEALDSSAQAMMLANSLFRQRRTRTSPVDPRLERQSVASYMKALRALRSCLNDPRRASTPETLCSTALLMFYEALSGHDDIRTLSHAGGAAQILKARGRMAGRNDFEEKILLSIRGPAIIMAMMSPKFIFTADEWQAIVVNPIDGAGPDAKLMHTMAKLPNIFHALRAVLAESSINALELARLEEVILQLLAEQKPRRDFIKQRFESHVLPLHDKTTADRAAKMWHCQLARQVALACSVDIMLLLMVSAARRPRIMISETELDMVECADQWQIEALALAKEIADLADQVVLHRPLGPLYMAYSLRVAHTAGLNDDLCRRLEGLIVDFLSDIEGRQVNVDKQALGWLRDYLHLRDVRRGPVSNMA